MKLSQKMVDDPGSDQMRAIDNKMRGIAIKRVADGVQFFQFGERVGDTKEWTITVVARPLVEQSRRDIQIYHPTGVVKSAAIFRIEYDTTTGRHDNFTTSGQLGDGLRLTTPEALLALDLEDRRDWHAGAGDDLMVGIMKGAPEATR